MQDSNPSRYYPHEGNSSITTTLTIHYTPEHYHLVSWGILWVGFVLAIGFASYQVWMDNTWFSAARTRADLEQGGSSSNAASGEGDAVSSADLTRSRVRKNLCIS